jgi:hypothetical protein
LGHRCTLEGPMHRLTSRESRAFRNGLLLGLAILGGALFGLAGASAPAACDPAAREVAVLASVLDRVTTPDQPALRLGQRVTRALLQRAFGRCE